MNELELKFKSASGEYYAPSEDIFGNYYQTGEKIRIPISYLQNKPFNLKAGDKIEAIMRARNKMGWSPMTDPSELILHGYHEMLVRAAPEAEQEIKPAFNEDALPVETYKDNSGDEKTSFGSYFDAFKNAPTMSMVAEVSLKYWQSLI